MTDEKSYIINKNDTLDTNNRLSINSIKAKISNNFQSPIKRPLSCRVEYPHLTLSAFARAFRDFIHYSVYKQFTAIIFGAYNKALQSHIQTKQTQEFGIPDYGTPLMSYTFQIDSTDEKVDSPWRSSTFLPGLSRGIYKSFYIDDEIDLKLIFRRLKGSINSTIYCSSEAEMFDIQFSFFDAFHGLNCFRQSKMRSYAIIPDHFIFTDYYGNKIGKALMGNQMGKSFIKSVNSSNYFLFMNTRSLLNLQNITPSANYYGGTGFPEYNLSASMSFEIEIPQYILCLTNQQYSGIDINMQMDYVYDDDKILKSLKSILGEPIYDTNLTTSRYEQDCIQFEHGSIIARAALKVDRENFNELDYDILFPKPRSFNYNEKDCLMIILFSGGLILSSDSEDYYSFEDNHLIKFKKELFSAGDLIEIFIFKYNYFGDGSYEVNMSNSTGTKTKDRRGVVMGKISNMP